MRISMIIKKIYGLVILFIWPTIIVQATTPQLPFKKIIIWGHKLYSHTHSHVHHAFYRTFKHLGYDTYWLDNADQIATFDFSNSLFIAEGGVDQNIPLLTNCRYILHNCNLEKYKELFEKNLCLILQVYTHDCLARDVKKIDDCIYYQPDAKTLYMPWATDLLPHEIDEIKQHIPQREKNKVIYWIGTIWDGFFGNREVISRFEKACSEQGIEFKHLGNISNISIEDTIKYTQDSYIAPALQGSWQCESGYIPCRIFKNISYGQIGATNSKTVYELFNKKIVYNDDAYQLFFDTHHRSLTISQDELFELMDFVKNKHTYINRIKCLLDTLHMIHPLKKCSSHLE